MWQVLILGILILLSAGMNYNPNIDWREKKSPYKDIDWEKSYGISLEEGRIRCDVILKKSGGLQLFATQTSEHQTITQSISLDIISSQPKIKKATVTYFSDGSHKDTPADIFNERCLNSAAKGNLPRGVKDNIRKIYPRK